MNGGGRGLPRGSLGRRAGSQKQRRLEKLTEVIFTGTKLHRVIGVRR